MLTMPRSRPRCPLRTAAKVTSAMMETAFIWRSRPGLRFKYVFRYKEKRFSLGQYPGVSLKDARDKAREARLLLLDGVDPSEERKARKAEIKVQSTETVEIIGREWFEKFKHQWTASTPSRSFTDWRSMSFR